MLDTVILTIPRGAYKLKPEMFVPNAEILTGRGCNLVKCVSNPSAQDKKNGIYRPRLTLIKRMTRNGIEIPLKIEFSAPKMLFGNNVDELEEKDFGKVIENLHKSVMEMGALVPKEMLINAKVSAFHSSKNIELKDGYTSGFVITELNKINLSKKMDLNKDSFRNNGQSLQFYTNSHSLVVYDKVQDLRKPGKRAMDKDQNSIQASLFDLLVDKKNKKEILRIEARLAKKVKMNAILKNLGFKENPTFEEIFNRDLCQKILQNYWQEIIVGKNLFLFELETNPLKMLEKIFQSNPNIGAKQASYLVGLWTLSKEGIRATRTIIERNANKRTWSRISKDLLHLDTISDKKYHSWVKQIEKCLKEFKPFSIKIN